MCLQAFLCLQVFAPLPSPRWDQVQTAEKSGLALLAPLGSFSFHLGFGLESQSAFSSDLGEIQFTPVITRRSPLRCQASR